jgi:hypothetical protein
MSPLGWNLSPLLQDCPEGGGMRWAKTTAGPVYLQSLRLLLGVGACFILVSTSERLPMRTTRDVWSRTICELSVESVWRVDQVFPCRVYIDSNCHDSWIWVSLVCGSHHVDNLTILMSLFVIVGCCSIHLNVCNSYMIRVGCTFLSKWFE